jgi:tetratricopeptide (TPR) repeat protein
MYFDFSIKYYPESANAYDSMADYYERIGDNQNAVKFVTKAFEISKDDYYRKRIEELKK